MKIVKITKKTITETHKMTNIYNVWKMIIAFMSIFFCFNTLFDTAICDKV